MREGRKDGGRRSKVKGSQEICCAFTQKQKADLRQPQAFLYSELLKLPGNSFTRFTFYILHFPFSILHHLPPTTYHLPLQCITPSILRLSSGYICRMSSSIISPRDGLCLERELLIRYQSSWLRARESPE